MKMHKFVFEDFLTPPAPQVLTEVEVEAEPPAPTFSEDELRAREAISRQDGFQEGFEAGYGKAKGEIDQDYQQLTAAVQNLSYQLESLTRQMHDERSAREATSLQLVTAVARKIIGMVPEESLVEAVRPMLTEALHTLYDVPEAKAFVNPNLVAGLENILPGILGETLYRGTLHIEADAHLEPGACRLEWQGGSAIRTPKTLWEQLEQVLLGKSSGDTPSQNHTKQEP